MKFTNDTLTHEQYLKTAADLSKDNEYITETAGFIPLEVKMKQFEQNGIVAQFMQSDFTSNDYREIYLNNPDFQITPEDDLEDIQEKLMAQREFAEKIKAAKPNGVNEPPKAAKAGAEEPKNPEEVPEEAE